MTELLELEPTRKIALEVAAAVNALLPHFNVKEPDPDTAVEHGAGNCFAAAQLAIEELLERDIEHYFAQQAPKWLVVPGFPHSEVIIPVQDHKVHSLVLDTPGFRVSKDTSIVREFPRKSRRLPRDRRLLNTGQTVVAWDNAPGFGPLRVHIDTPRVGIEKYKLRTGLTNRGQVA